MSNIRIRLVFRLRFRRYFAFNGLPVLLGLLGLIVAHAFLEVFHRATQVAANVAQLLGAKYQNNDQQYDQPMPNT